MDFVWAVTCQAIEQADGEGYSLRGLYRDGIEVPGAFPVAADVTVALMVEGTTEEFDGPVEVDVLIKMRDPDGALVYDTNTVYGVWDYQPDRYRDLPARTLFRCPLTLAFQKPGKHELEFSMFGQTRLLPLMLHQAGGQ